MVEGRAGFSKNIIIKAVCAVVVLLLVAALCKPEMLYADSKVKTSLKSDKDGYYKISDRDDFTAFIKLCRQDASVSGRLMKDIVLNDDEAFDGQVNLSTFESIYEGSLDDMKGFSGDFDGNGHSLKGYVSCENLPVFFIIEKEGCVHDLTITDSIFSPTYNKRKDEKTEYSASIAELNYGKIADCTVRASVVGRAEAAGIAGVNETSGVIENTEFSGKITGGYGLKIAPDSGIKYAYDLVVVDNGRISGCKADAVIKTVAGLSVPYTISGKDDEGAAKGGSAAAKSGDGVKSGDSAKSGNAAKTGDSAKTGDGSKDSAKSENSSKNASEGGKASDDASKSGKASDEASEGGKASDDASEGVADEEDDYIGPDKDTVIQLVKGDTLWHIARVYYGRGIKYKRLKLRDKNGRFGGLEGHVLTRLQIGTDVFIPRLDAKELETDD